MAPLSRVQACRPRRIVKLDVVYLVVGEAEDIQRQLGDAHCPEWLAAKQPLPAIADPILRLTRKLALAADGSSTGVHRRHSAGGFRAQQSHGSRTHHRPDTPWVQSAPPHTGHRFVSVLAVAPPHSTRRDVGRHHIDRRHATAPASSRPSQFQKNFQGHVPVEPAPPTGQTHTPVRFRLPARPVGDPMPSPAAEFTILRPAPN